jgi:hypothetical protein
VGKYSNDTVFLGIERKHALKNVPETQQTPNIPKRAGFISADYGVLRTKPKTGIKVIYHCISVGHESALPPISLNQSAVYL